MFHTSKYHCLIHQSFIATEFLFENPLPLQGDADIVVKRMKDHSVVLNLRTAQKHSEEEIRSFYTKVKLPGDFSAMVYVQLPEGMDETKKYPVIVKVYGGPGSKVNTLYVDWKNTELLIETYFRLLLYLRSGLSPI